MGFDYWLVHAKWTIPPALVLWLFFRRLRTARDVYKTWFLITIAVLATIPWDSYLIRNRIWSYPQSSVVGPTLFAIPYEEVFFFFIQTYITSAVYALFTRPVVHAVLLPTKPEQGRTKRYFGTAIFLLVTALSITKIKEGGEGTYLALIVGWVAPFLALLWFITSTHILAMPRYSVILPILLPTLYLWECDARALQRGTWVIEQGTKLGLSYRGLEIEEAVFFLLTNLMIVFGLVACDYCLAVHDLRSYDKGYSSPFPPIQDFLPILANQPDTKQAQRIIDLRNAIDILEVHSKSFSTASMVFDGRLRLDLLSLYAWCRVCDDLIDNASSVPVASANITGIRTFLTYAYTRYDSTDQDSSTLPRPLTKVQLDTSLPLLSEKERGPFRLLTFLPITRGPLEELLTGFETDLSFIASALEEKEKKKNNDLPIKTDQDLMDYSSNVASSVADLCVQLVFAHSTPSSSSASSTSSDESKKRETLLAARKMGKALQLVNIARDVPADQKINRMYLPSRPIDSPIETLTEERRRLLKLAKEMAEESRVAIEGLPQEARGGIRAACDVYLSIGKAVEEALKDGRIEERARVGKFTRAKTAWRAL
uniref:Bifunctional lycopene cyclase/phytoene synthase n=1 Tax=Sporobolomyces pararoseus TaxID=5003 RepID=A0A0K0QV93_9BASI|nr:lycopene cyclase/phytoene synthase [Sporobolomyces pararoseus]UGY86997.1 bifunctional lycopene cyclase-phytoene synthase [Sporobolomyces pararoseus]UGY87003.1 bifunctional lycopene cyclase-phytoene synthase [synthetic construct]